jgi:hypothetical protein
MEQYDIERGDAVKRISESGRNKDDFLFHRTYLPPDPDGDGMFTVQYDVTISNKITSKSLNLTGGIGWKWVDHFESELRDGYFD